MGYSASSAKPHWAKSRFIALSGQYTGLYCIQKVETMAISKIEKPILMKKTRSMKRQTRNTIRWANDDDGYFTLSPHHLTRIARTNFCGCLNGSMGSVASVVDDQYFISLNFFNQPSTQQHPHAKLTEPNGELPGWDGTVWWGDESIRESAGTQPGAFGSAVQTKDDLEKDRFFR